MNTPLVMGPLEWRDFDTLVNSLKHEGLKITIYWNGFLIITNNKYMDFLIYQIKCFELILTIVFDIILTKWFLTYWWTQFISNWILPNSNIYDIYIYIYIYIYNYNIVIINNYYHIYITV